MACTVIKPHPSQSDESERRTFGGYSHKNPDDISEDTYKYMAGLLKDPIVDRRNEPSETTFGGYCISDEDIGEDMYKYIISDEDI